MFEYGFELNKDYVEVVVKNNYNSKGGKSELIDYVLTLDCSKEIAMLQRSEKTYSYKCQFIDIFMLFVPHLYHYIIIN